MERNVISFYRESTFRGWQLFCVLLVTFPPSKDFEPSLRSYLHQATNQSESRVDVMAKYCLRRLGNISRKGPRGKPPSLTEIESAAVSNPSFFCFFFLPQEIDLIWLWLGRSLPPLHFRRIPRCYFQTPRTQLLSPQNTHHPPFPRRWYPCSRRHEIRRHLPYPRWLGLCLGTQTPDWQRILHSRWIRWSYCPRFPA